MVLKLKKKFVMLLSFMMMLTLCTVIVSAETTVDVKQVNADANFSRIEFSTNTDGSVTEGVTILANDPYSFSFTPQTTGTYAVWYMRPQSFQVDGGSNAISLTVAPQEGEAVYDVPAYTALYHSQMAGVDPVLERINGAANAVPRSMELTAGETYTVTITPTADLTLYAMDFRCLDLPVNGATALSPADFINTNLSDNVPIVRIPASFEGAADISPDYTLVGNYAYEGLTRKDTKYRSIHPGTNSWMEYNINVETPGLYDVTTYTGTYGFSDTPTKRIENHLYLDGVYLTTISKEVTPDAQKFYGTSQQFYLSEGSHTLRISTIGSEYGAYIGAIQLTPRESADNMVTVDVSDTSSPVIINDAFLIGSDGATNTNNTWNLDNGSSVTLSFSVDETKTLELSARKITAPENALIEYVIDEEPAVEVSLVEYGNIFSEKEVSAGAHTLKITSRTDGIQINSLSFRDKLPQSADVTDILPVGDTQIDLFSYSSGFGDINLSNEGQSLSFGNGSEITYRFRIQEEGLYTVYMNALAPQRGFDIYIDDEEEPCTSYMFAFIDSNGTNSEGKRLYDNPHVAYTNVQDKELIMYGISLAEGEHSFTLKFKNGYMSPNNTTEPVEITDADNFMSVVNRLWISRIDPEVGTKDGVILRAWEVTADGPQSSGWSYVNQYGQGGELVIDEKSYRSTVFMNGTAYTYTLHAANDGYYDFSVYFRDKTAESENPYFTLQIDGGETINVPVAFTGGSGTLKATQEKIYLTAGKHTFRIVGASETLPGVNRIYAIGLAKSGINTVVIDETAKTAAVDAYFDAPQTGIAVVALYGSDNELVGIYQTSLSNTDSISAEVAFDKTPAVVKVFAWNNLETVKPLTKNIVVADTDSDNWIIQ